MTHKDALGVTNQNLKGGEWDSIEDKISPSLKSVTMSMVLFGKQISQTGDYKSESISTNSYQINDLTKIVLEKFSEKFQKVIPKPLFEKLRELLLLDSKKEDSTKKKKKSKKGNSGQQMKEQIRIKTILKKIEEDFELINKTTSDMLVESQFALIESKLLNYLVWYFKLYDVQKKSSPSYLLYDCLLSLSRAIEYFQKNYIGISEELFLYCSHALEFGVSKINIKNLQMNYPELITECSFDKFSHQFKLKLYDCQKEVLRHIYQSLQSKIPIMINYQTPPGAGKTTLVIALARMVGDFSKQVIYVCYNNIVRKEVSKMLFHSGTTFAIVSDCNIKPHNSCFNSKKNKGKPSDHENRCLRLNSELARIKAKCDKQPVVLVCDMTSAVLLLKTSNSQEKYVAYIDEPTAGAEESNSLMTTEYMKIILGCPSITVCLSATMPKNEETPLLYDNFKSKFQCDDTRIMTIVSSLIPINCEVIDSQGNIVCPHNLAQDTQHLQEIVSYMEEKPFLLRFYTVITLYQLRTILDEYPGCQLEPYTPTLSDLNHSHTRQECLKLLKIMIQLDNPEIIQKLKVRIPVLSGPEKKIFDLDTCLNSTAHENFGQTLLIKRDSDCHELVLVKSQQFLVDNEAPKLKYQFKEYNRQVQEYKRKLSVIEKSTNVKGADENSKAKDALEFPSFNWNSKLTVNSMEHLTCYSGLSPEEISQYDRFIKLCPLNQGLDIETVKEFPDIYDSGILMGVAVIDPSSTLLSSNGNIYNEEVLKLASQGFLSYISSNKSISYGTNLPIQKVVIDNTGQSQNTLHQQLGRVGRLGKSLSGSAVIEDDRLLHLAFTRIPQNIEAQHMNHAIDKILADG